MTTPGTDSGPVTPIGPECFASADASVICWQGVNYYREPDDDELARVFVVMDGMATEVSGEVRDTDFDDDPVCTTCGQPMDDPDWCARDPLTGKGGHTHGGGVRDAR